MTPPATIRAAQPDDLPRLLPLFRHLDAPDEAAPDPAAARAAFARLLRMEGVTVFVAELPGPSPVLAATCTLIVMPNVTHQARPHALIENVATLADHRQQGLGSAVLRAAVAAAREAGCYKVVLTTGSKRESTLRFYEQTGFARGTRTAFQIRWN